MMLDIRSENVPGGCTTSLPEWSFKEIAAELVEAVVVLDDKFCILFCNDSAEKMFGHTTDALQGRSIDVLIAESLSEIHKSLAYMKIADSKVTHRNNDTRVLYGMHASGRRFPLHVTLTPKSLQGEDFIICFINDTSASVAQQKALLESEQRYRGIVESQSVLVNRVDLNGCITYTNQAYCQMFGQTSEDLLGNIFQPSVHPDDLQSTLNARKMLIQPPYRVNFEQRLLAVCGWKWISWTNTLITDTNGIPTEIQSVGYDISEQKKAEEVAIIERNLAMVLAQKSSLSEAIPLFLDLALKVSDMDCGGIYMVDRQNGDLVLSGYRGLSDSFISQSQRFRKGTDRHQLVMGGEPVYQPYFQVSLAKNSVNLQEGLHSFAVIPIRFDGKVIACINVASHLHDDIPSFRRKALENLAFQMGNLLSRFQVLEDLAANEYQLQSMFDSLMDFVFVLDTQASIIQVNRKVLDSLGYTREELIGQNVLMVHPPEQREQAGRIVQDMIHGVRDTCPLDLMSRDGKTIPVETKVAPGRWGNQDVLIGISRDITDRLKAEDLIHQKAKDLEDFFSLSPDLLCIADFNGNFVRVNDAWQTTLGYAVEELEQRRFLDFVHPDDMVATRKELAKLTHGEHVFNFVNRYKGGDGAWHYIEWHSQAQGDLVFAAARDITERKSAEIQQARQNRLLEYRNRFEEMLTSISTRFINLPASGMDGLINEVLGQIGEFESIDRSYVFLLNEPKQEMSNTHEWCALEIEAQKSVLQNIPVSLVPWWMARLEALQEVHIPDVTLLPPEAKSEREILEAQDIKSVLVVPMVFNNRLIGFLGFDSVAQQRYWTQDSILLIKMVGDILSNAIMRTQMENDLRQSEEHNRALLSAIPDIIFRIQRDGTFLDYKVSSDELLAIPKDRIIGANIRTIMEEAIASKALECIEQALQTGQVQTIEYSMKIGDSTPIFEARFKNIGSDEVIAIIRDISDRARLEQMKSDFINRATHELRTPVATMLLMVNLMEGGATEEEHEEYWTVLKSELNRERLLIEDLLTAGRMENDRTHFHLHPIDLQVLIQQVVQPLEISAREKGLSLQVEMDLPLDRPTPAVLADETAISQVMVNLVGNAIKFSPAGGQVTVRLQEAYNGLKISVIDTGIGIPSEDLPLLFSRFFRGSNAIHNEIQGTGIGLYIVRSIVEKHNGKIQVTSELGKGSQFDVWIPVITE